MALFPLDRVCAGNLDFENLSQSLHVVWRKFGEDTDNYLNQSQLEKVCERVGFHPKIAFQVADEVFEKLGLNKKKHLISFNEFLALIQSDTDVLPPPATTSFQPSVRTCSSQTPPPLTTDKSFDSLSYILSRSATTMAITTKNIITATQDSSCSHLLHAHSGLFLIFR